MKKQRKKMSNSNQTSKVIVKVSQEITNDTNGNTYAKVKLVERATIKTPFGEIAKPLSQCENGHLNVWETSYIENKLEEEVFAAPIFDEKNPTKGGWFLGAIVRRFVEPYYIGENLVNTDKTVVFGDTTDEASFEKAVQAAFKQKKRVLVDTSTGEVQDTSVKEEVMEDSDVISIID